MLSPDDPLRSLWEQQDEQYQTFGYPNTGPLAEHDTLQEEFERRDRAADRRAERGGTGGWFA